MQTLIKRFTQEITDLDLVLISILAALLSIKLTFLAPATQFLVTSFIVVAFTVSLLKAMPGDARFNRAVRVLVMVLFLLLSSSGVKFLTVLMFLTLVMIPFGSESLLNIHLKSFISHLADVVATYSVLSVLTEANPFMRVLIGFIGALPALILGKVLLVGLPLLYSYRKMDEISARFFAQLTFVLGMSLTARTLFLVLS